MKHGRLVLIAIIITVIAACGQSKTEGVPAGWKTFKQDNYSIQYPDSFELNTSGIMGVKFALVLKQVSPDDLLRENINLIIEDLKGQDVSLKYYAEQAEKYIKMLITNVDIIENRIIEKDDPELLLIYTGIMGELKLKYEQRVVIKGGKAYVLTFTTEASKSDRHKEVVEQILNSFRVK